jgi:hypothetical protein
VCCGSPARIDAAATLHVVSADAAERCGRNGAAAVRVRPTRVPSTALPKKKRKRRKLVAVATSAPRPAAGAVSIEIEIGDAVIRVRQGVDGRTVAVVLEAMKTAR